MSNSHHTACLDRGSTEQTDDANSTMPFESIYQGEEHGMSVMFSTVNRPRGAVHDRDWKGAHSNYTVRTEPSNRYFVPRQRPFVLHQADSSFTNHTRMDDCVDPLAQPEKLSQAPSLFGLEYAHSPPWTIMNTTHPWSYQVNQAIRPSPVTVPSLCGPLDQTLTCFPEELSNSARYTLQSSDPMEDEPSHHYPGHSSTSMSARGNGAPNASTSAVIYGGITKIHVRRPKKAATKRGPPDISANDFVASKIDNAMEYSVSASQSRSTRSFDKVRRRIDTLGRFYSYAATDFASHADAVRVAILPFLSDPNNTGFSTFLGEFICERMVVLLDAYIQVVEKRMVWVDPNYQGDLTEQLRNNIQEISRALRIITEAWEVQLATGTQGRYKVTYIREKEERTSVC